MKQDVFNFFFFWLVVVLYCPLLIASSTDIPHVNPLPSFSNSVDSSICSSALSDTGAMTSIDSVLAKKTYSRLTFYRSKNPLAKERPILVLIPGGLGLSHRTLKSLHILAQEFHLIYVDPPGVWEAHEDFFRDINIYEKVVNDIATNLYRNTAGRSMVLIGHSYGGTVAADIAANYGKTILPSLSGLVFMASAHTSETFRDMSQRRRKVLNSVPNYKKFKEQLFFRSEEVWREKILSSINSPKEISDKKIKRLIELNDHNSVIGFILSQGPILWNELEEAVVRPLIEQELHNCSPNCMRYAQKIWSEDKNQDGMTQNKLKSFSRLKIHSFIGEKDLYYHNDLLIKEARAVGAKIHVFQDGSHFFPISYPEEILAILLNEFTTTKTK